MIHILFHFVRVSSLTAYKVRESRGEAEGKKQTDITVTLMASITSLTLPWAHPEVSEVAR